MAKPEDNVQPAVRIGIRLILISSLLLFLLATASEVYRIPPNRMAEPPATKSTINDFWIVPGTRIGPVTLGLSTEKMTSSLGKGQLRPHNGGFIHLYEEYGLAVYSENDIVISVTVRSSQFQTKSGVSVGSDVDTVISTLGKDYEEVGDKKHLNYVLHNWNRGWHVGIEGTKVTFFQITSTLDPAEPNVVKNN